MKATMKATVTIVILPDGQVKADVAGVEGHACVSQILAGLIGDLGTPSTTNLKPEFEMDVEAQALMRKMGIQV